MEDRLFVRIFFPSEEISFENVISWIENFVLFSPTKMRTKMTERTYKQNALYKELEKVLKENNNFQLDLKDDENSFTLSTANFPSILCIYSQPIIEQFSMEDIIEKFNFFFENHNGIVGYAVSENDQKWQNNTDIEEFIKANMSIENLKFTQHRIKKDRLIIDKESFPGHNHFIGNLWFGSTWKMWFGKKYYEYIEKEKLLEFNGCYEKRELENNSLSITLYKNIRDYDLFENRQLQWKFRNIVGMDEVAHNIKNFR